MKISLQGVHRPGWLLFCGRGWPVYLPSRLKNSHGEQPFETGFALLEEIVRRFNKVPRDDVTAHDAEAFFGDDEDYDENNYYEDKPSTYQRLGSVDERLAGIEVGEDVLLGLRAPCALLIPIFDHHPRDEPRRVDLIANPHLGDLGFPRVLDPYTCYQTIETFLGNQLAPPDLAPQRVGSDEILARQKGFDEASFRTSAPGTKKENRARNRARKHGGSSA